MEIGLIRPTVTVGRHAGIGRIKGFHTNDTFVVVVNDDHGPTGRRRPAHLLLLRDGHLLLQ